MKGGNRSDVEVWIQTIQPKESGGRNRSRHEGTVGPAWSALQAMQPQAGGGGSQSGKVQRRREPKETSRIS